MNHESSLQYPLGDTVPAPTQTLEVAPGIKWLRMALPFALDHINLWLIRDQLADASGQMRQGWTIVDCCVKSPQSQAQWEEVFANELDGLPVLRVIVTHMHPDHIGMAGWLCERWQAPLCISATDFNVARVAMLDQDGFGGESSAQFYRLHGSTDEEFLKHVQSRRSYYGSLVHELPITFHRLMDGDRLVIGGQHWQCIAGYGHAPEHIALYCASLNVLISGDMVLPRISANVSVHSSEPEANPLELFMRSLNRYFALPPDCLVLPSHGKPFAGLHIRTQQLLNHHQARLNDIIEAAQTKALSAFDILPLLFQRKLDTHQTTFAMGEALAHLHYLWFSKALERKLDANGVFRFQKSRQ